MNTESGIKGFREPISLKGRKGRMEDELEEGNVRAGKASDCAAAYKGIAGRPVV